jgi:hypothetical protein
VAWAVDLYHISTCLGNESFRSVAVDLGKITRGRLLASGGGSGAKNHLSQFWVGALLAQSKLNPRILAYESHGKAKPDFLIEFGHVTYAVEVKRPSNCAAVRLVNEAGDQIRRYDRPGLIIIDATDCMSADPWEVTREGPSVRARVAQELGTLQNRLARFIERYSRSNKFHQVTMLITFARYWSFVTDNGPRRDAGMNLRATAFSYRWSHQVTALNKGIQDGILRGLEQLTGNPPQHRYS